MKNSGRKAAAAPLARSPRAAPAKRSLQEGKAALKITNLPGSGRCGGGGAGSRTRVRERPLYRDYVRSRFVFLSCELKSQQDAHNPVRLISTFRYEQKLEPIPPYDANDTHAGLGTTAATYLIKQRKQTADWQLLFSDRLTGAQNPARLHTMNRTRRSHFAPTLVLLHTTTN